MLIYDRDKICATQARCLNESLGSVIATFPKVFRRGYRAILEKIPVEMRQLTRIPMRRLNVSLMLENFCQCATPEKLIL